MAKLLLILSILFLSHEVLSQIIRQPDSLLSRNLIEALFESTRQELPRYISQIDPFIPNTIANSPYIPDFPINIPDFPINMPNPAISIPNPAISIPSPAISIPSPAINIPGPAISMPRPSNSLISIPSPSDPSVCKNLANTIQLMVLSDLLKSREVDEIASRLAGPVLSNLISIPRSSIRSNLGTNLNSLSPIPNVIPSNVVRPSVTNSPRIVVSPSSPNIMSSVSNGRIDRGVLTNMLKLLGGAL